MTRLSRARVCEVLDKLDIAVEKSDAHGIEIRRTTCPRGLRALMELERWRLQTGGGIAGNSDQIWLSPVGKHPPRFATTPHEARGPFKTKAPLEKALRAWRRGQ